MATVARIRAAGAADGEATRKGAARQSKRKASPALRTKKNRPSSRKVASSNADRIPAAALVKKPNAIPADTPAAGAGKQRTAEKGRRSGAARRRFTPPETSRGAYPPICHILRGSRSR